MLSRTARTVSELSKYGSLQATRFGVIGCDMVLTQGDFAKEEQIFSEGDPAVNVYQVVSGAVRNLKLLSDGRCQITAFHLPGDIFGFELGPEHTTSAEALVNTAVRIVKRQMLQHAAATNAAVANQLWMLTAGKLRHAEDHLLLLGRKTAVERVTAFLGEMDDRLDGKGDVPLPMRRSDIGDYLGLTLETVSRVLSELHSGGVIDFSGSARHIVLRNRKRLRAMESAIDLN